MVRKTRQRGVKALGNGRYELRLYINGRDYIRTVEAKSTRDAAAKRPELASEILVTIAPPERSKLSTVAEVWLTRKKAGKRRDGSKRLTPNTLDRYTNAIEKHITPILGEYAVDDLTRRIVLDWRDALGEAYAAATVNGYLGVLKSILSDYGNRAADRVEPIEEDDTRITDDEPNLLTAPELKRFLEAARPSVHFPLVLFLVSTGTRISTARALCWEDLDPEAGVVHLRRRYSGKEVLPGVKRSRTSKDVAPLLPELHELLEAKRAGFNDEQKASGLVFPNTKGGPIARSILAKPFEGYLRKAKLSKRFTPHGLRRTAALLYRLAGTSTIARDVLGHQTEAMHRHYAPEQAEERRAAAERAFGDLLGGDRAAKPEAETGTSTGT